MRLQRAFPMHAAVGEYSTEDFRFLSPCTPVSGCDEVPLTPDAVSMAPRTLDFDAAPRAPESFVMFPCTPCTVVPDLAPGLDASLVRRRISRKLRPPAAYLEKPDVNASIWDLPP